MKKVIFIQGIHDFSIKNKKLINFLNESGFEVIYFTAFYTVIDIKEQKKLLTKINQYIKESPEIVSILGHSFGGILAYSLDEESYKKIYSIVTVGSPHTLKHKWFLKVISDVGYKKHTVRKQTSVGMSDDILVDKKYTNYSTELPYYVLTGFHETILRNKKIMQKVISFL